VAPVVPLVAPVAELPEPLSIFVRMNCPPAPADAEPEAPVVPDVPEPAVLPEPVAPAVLPEPVAPAVPEPVVPAVEPEPVAPIEPLALAGIRQPVTVMLLPVCDPEVDGDDGDDVPCAAAVIPAMANAPQAAKIVRFITICLLCLAKAPLRSPAP